MDAEKKVLVSLLSEQDIQKLIDKRIADAMRLNVPNPIRKTNLDPNDAIDYLAEIGYKCSLSQLYKASAKNEVPFSKFGRKLLFNADELSKWVESKKQKTIDISMVVAKSANLKMGR
jgi:hypothetical protein